MKKLLLTILFLVLATNGFCQVHVNGYFRKDGTYVQPYYRSSPNDTTDDNYSTKGNYNPYTGERGTVTRKTEQDFYGRKSSSDEIYGYTPMVR